MDKLLEYVRFNREDYRHLVSGELSANVIRHYLEAAVNSGYSVILYSANPETNPKGVVVIRSEEDFIPAVNDSYDIVAVEDIRGCKSETMQFLGNRRCYFASTLEYELESEEARLFDIFTKVSSEGDEFVCEVRGVTPLNKTVIIGQANTGKTTFLNSLMDRLHSPRTVYYGHDRRGTSHMQYEASSFEDLVTFISLHKVDTAFIDCDTFTSEEMNTLPDLLNGLPYYAITLHAGSPLIEKFSDATDVVNCTRMADGTIAYTDAEGAPLLLGE